MLTAQTKSKINSARDILVGKIPDPKGQIDQITNALIYKFMDDQDRTAQSLPGGQPSFFVGEVADYAWHKLFDKKLTNQDRANLYIDGLQKLSQSTHLPDLFKSIFKEAYLPFRDASTIAMFLDKINEFDYNHSEELGNAFEYLLSIMGSQGDAGQFRTPRHIIKFIVDILQPQPHETIIDPACGTAGFLVEAYNYISSNNKLTQSEKQKLSGNLTGVDIDPGMAKIARVNLYLHGFKTPKITEDDTLTNPNLWGTKYDVILANPPFMTPKGGIKPHDKFVKANKAEVLFTDYISEHLKLEGRAGIVVPEGIIFQSATAYKALRKKLVDDNYLLAVISLPSGVFQPYSGVKTSILILDRKRAKASDSVLFIKIQSDGFDLSAQRRENTKNDLPEALKIIKNFETAIKNQNLSELVQIVPKAKLRESGDYNLSGDRYKASTDYTNSKYPMVELGDVVDILDSKRKPITKSDRESGDYPYYGATGILDHVKDYIFSEKLVLIGEDGAKWNIGDKTAFIVEGKYWVNNHAHVIRPKRNLILDEIIVELLNGLDLNKYITGITVPKLNQENLRSIKIPLPPLEIQQKIVEEISGYQKIIDGAKQITANWKPKIDIDPTWEMVKLGDVCNVGSSKRIMQSDYVEVGIPFYRTKEIVELGNGELPTLELFIKKEQFEEIDRKFESPKENDILISAVGTLGKIWRVPKNYEQFYFKDGNLLWLKNQKNVTPKYLEEVLKTILPKFVEDNKAGAAYQAITIQGLRTLSIPLPPLPIQNEIVERIEHERALVDSAKQLIAIYEAKIKAVIAKVWADVEEAK